jgi:sporulation protein YlmC with PRC-barrel domain
MAARSRRVSRRTKGMRFEALKDKPVVSIAEGTELGKVRDFLLTESYLQIAAVVIGGGGLFGGNRQAVAYRAIRSVGPDAVMVQGREAVEEVDGDSSFASLPSLGDLRQDVMSEQGTHLGRVQDAEFDQQTGALTHLWFVSHGPRIGQREDVYEVARDDILSLSAKMAVVRQNATRAPAP